VIKLVTRLLTLTTLCLLLSVVNAEDSVVQKGARIYLERCSLCHGSKALGEGPMAILVNDYPDPRLNKVQASRQSLRHIVEHGSRPDTSSPYSPPWQDELDESQIKSITAFIELLRDDFETGTALIASVDLPPDLIDGRKIFRARCEGCHGVTGEGNGRLSRVITDPPPSNLTLSKLSYADTIAMISAGGEALGRSPRMPPWGQELLAAELVSIVDYLKTLRVKPE